MIRLNDKCLVFGCLVEDVGRFLDGNGKMVEMLELNKYYNSFSPATIHAHVPIVQLVFRHEVVVSLVSGKEILS